MNDFYLQYNSYKSLINQRLHDLIYCQNIDSQVAKAMNYSLNIGGKRIRPILVLAFCELCNGTKESALDIACAIEMIHTYSLIHDDLPCMDNDDLRRGKPACHIKFGQAVALLAGDGLLTLAFNIISLANLKSDLKVDIIEKLSDAIGLNGMILGQNLDIAQDPNLDLKTISKINYLKTTKLIKVSSIIGCMIAGANLKKIEAASLYSDNIGLAFQIKDDIIDVIGNENITGKPVLSDKINDKTTFIDLIGLQNCEEKIKDLSNLALNSLKSNFNIKNCNFIFKLTDFLLNRVN